MTLRPVWLLGLPALAVLAVAPAYVGYATSPFVPLVLAAGLAFVVLAAIRPGWALPIGCALAPLEYVQVPVNGLGSLSPTETAFLVIAGGWLWRALTAPDRVVFPGFGDFPAIAFVLLLLPGAAVGPDMQLVLRLAVMWTAFFVVSLVVRELSPREVRRVLLALGLGAGILGLQGVLGYLGVLGGPAEGGVIGRASSGIADPNYYGAYLLVAGVPLLGLVLGRVARPRGLALAAAVAAVAGVVLSFSRGALVGLVLALAIVLAAWSRTRWVTAAIAVTALAVTVFTGQSIVQGRVTETLSERFTDVTAESSDNKRLLLWRESLGVVDDHKVFGVGPGGWKGEAGRLGLTQGGDPLQNVHNTPLNVAVEMGLLALLAYLLWLARAFRDLVAELRRRRPNTFPIAVGVTAALAGYCLQSLTVSQYQVQIVIATVFVLTGVATTLRTWPG